MEAGGIEQLVLALATEFKKRGFGSAICCIENGGRLAVEARNRGIEVTELEMAWHGKFRMFRSLCNTLRKHKPAVIHSHNFKPFFYSSLARLCRATNVHVHSRHGALLKHHRALWRYRALRPWVNKFITVSTDRQSELAQLTGLPESKIAVLSNGVSTEHFCPAADKVEIRRQLGLSVSCLAIICAARLAPEKDLPTLLRALAFVRQTVPAVQLWLVGDGPELEFLKKLTVDLALESNVRFLGYRQDVNLFLQAADVFVLSSLSEGLSMALLEAASSGLPIVATDVGGNREIVNPPHGGYLIPPQNPVAMSAALIRLLQDPLLRQSMSTYGRALVLEKFSLERTITEHLKLYASLLNGRTANSPATLI
jgi:glycosyltransferase involved in cell wall biosynthesis